MNKLQALDKVSINFDEYLAEIWNNDETRGWGFFQRAGSEQ